MAPILTHLSTSSGLGGSSLTLLGSGFTSAATVHMGEQVVPISQISENQITVRVPHGLSGIQPVTVHNGQNRSQAFLFTVEGMVSTVVGAKTELPFNAFWAKPLESIIIDSMGNIYAIQKNQIVKADPKTNQIAPVAGTGVAGFSGDGGSAIHSQIQFPRSIAFDKYGDLYILDSGNGRIRKISKNFGVITTIYNELEHGSPINKISPNRSTFITFDSLNNLYIIQDNQIMKFDQGTQSISVVAGTNQWGFSGDNGPAHLAQLSGPRALVFDSLGNMYIADNNNNRIRKITHETGIITTVAGSGKDYMSGDVTDGAALQATLPGFYLMAIDPFNNLYLGGGGSLIKFDTRSAQLTTLMNSGTGSHGDGKPASMGSFWAVYGLAVDNLGNLNFGDIHSVRKIDKETGIVDSSLSMPIPVVDGPIQQLDQDSPGNMIFDKSGNMYFLDSTRHRICKTNHLTGMISIVAGTGIGGFSGDGEKATKAQLNSPSRFALDSQNNLFIAEHKNHRIRRVDNITGIITTVAGNGTDADNGAENFNIDNLSADKSRLKGPSAIALDANDNIYFADYNLLRKIDKKTNILTTIVKFYHDFPDILDLAIDSKGNVYAVDAHENHIYRIDKITGVFSIVSGEGEENKADDGGPAINSQLNDPSDIVFDNLGNLYIADTQNNRIRKVDASSGKISTVAGTGKETVSRDGIPATESNLGYPRSIALDSGGNLYIAGTSDFRIRLVDKQTGIISTIAGTDVPGYNGDNISAKVAQVGFPTWLALDHQDNLYFCDQSNRRIRRIEKKTGLISTVIGDGNFELNPNGTHLNQVKIGDIYGLGFDKLGNLYFSEANYIRKIDKTTTILSQISGNGFHGFGGDGGHSSKSQISFPGKPVFDSLGNLFFSDGLNSRIRRIDASTGVITTIAGTGVAGYSGDGGPATLAKLQAISSLAFDPFGNLYLTESFSHRIRKIDHKTGIISTVVGTGKRRFTGDGISAKESALNRPVAIAFDREDNLYIAEQGNHQIRKVDKATGLISTVAGIGGQGFSPDNVIATQINLSNPSSIAFDPAGNLHISDSGNHRIVKVHF